MRAFFKGWRRKLGSVLLVTALASMGMWLRSRVKYDFLDLNLKDQSYRLGTLEGSVSLIRLTPITGPQLFTFDSGDLTDIPQFQLDENARPDEQDASEGSNQEWHWDFAGFRLASGSTKLPPPIPALQWVSFVLPYWSITIPLTLLSGWLILWKPRSKG